MIPSIAAKINGLKSFRDNVGELVIDQAMKYQPEIIDMNTAQLDQGLDGNGNPIEPGYTPFTVSIKRGKGQVTSHVTLEDEGDFRRAFFVTRGSRYFALGSDDPKTRKLEQKYGKDIFGLTEPHIDDVAELIKPDLIEAFKKAVA